MACALGLGLALSSSFAAADEADPGNVQAAKLAFDAGREAMRQGDLQGALAHLRRGLGLHRSAGILLNLASCEEKLGLFASATAHYEEVVQKLPAGDERAPIAEQRIAAVAPRVPTLRVQFQGQTPSGVTVRIDGAEPAALADGPVRVDPGSHAITVGAPGHEERRLEVTLQAGDRQTLLVPPLVPVAEAPPSGSTASIPAPPAPPPAPPASSAVPSASAAPPAPDRGPAPAQGGGTASLIAGVAALGVGGAGLALGAVAGGLSLDKIGAVDALCGGDRVCDPSVRPVHAEGEALAHVSTAAFVVGGVAAAAGITLLVLRPGKGAAAPSAKVAVGPGGVVVLGRF